MYMMFFDVHVMGLSTLNVSFVLSLPKLSVVIRCLRQEMHVFVHNWAPGCWSSGLLGGRIEGMMILRRLLEFLSPTKGISGIALLILTLWWREFCFVFSHFLSGGFAGLCVIMKGTLVGVGFCL